jgi:hypothetical protein
VSHGENHTESLSLVFIAIVKSYYRSTIIMLKAIIKIKWLEYTKAFVINSAL